jgi:Ni,Fe-hydrogenase maturation factor
VDASVIDIDTYLLEKVHPDLKTDFSMHSCSPSFILGLCREISKNYPVVYQLHIKAYEFEFMKELSEPARKNLAAAENYLKKFLLKSLKL